MSTGLRATAGSTGQVCQSCKCRRAEGAQSTSGSRALDGPAVHHLATRQAPGQASPGGHCYGSPPSTGTRCTAWASILGTHCPKTESKSGILLLSRSTCALRHERQAQGERRKLTTRSAHRTSMCTGATPTCRTPAPSQETVRP